MGGLRAEVSAPIVVKMRKFHVSSVFAVAALSFGCSSVPGAPFTGGLGDPSSGGDAATAGQGGQNATGASGGVSGAPVAVGGSTSAQNVAGGSGGSLGGSAGSAGASVGGSGSSAGAQSIGGAGVGGSVADAGGAGVGGQTGDAPYPGCAGFTDYNVTHGCLKIVGRFIGGAFGSFSEQACTYKFTTSDVQTCGVADWTSQVGDMMVMVRAADAQSTYTVTRYDGECPPCIAPH